METNSASMDVSEAILGDLSNFAVGLVQLRDEAGSQVLGSAVLVNIDGRHGILTCGHVAELYKALPQVRFIQRPPQRLILSLEFTQTIIIEESAAIGPRMASISPSHIFPMRSLARSPRSMPS